MFPFFRYMNYGKNNKFIHVYLYFPFLVLNFFNFLFFFILYSQKFDFYFIFNLKYIIIGTNFYTILIFWLWHLIVRKIMEHYLFYFFLAAYLQISSKRNNHSALKIHNDKITIWLPFLFCICFIILFSLILSISHVSYHFSIFTIVIKWINLGKW